MLPILVELVPYLDWSRMPADVKDRALSALADANVKPNRPSRAPSPDPNAVQGRREPMALFLARRDGMVTSESMRAAGCSSSLALHARRGQLVRIAAGVYRLPEVA